MRRDTRRRFRGHPLRAPAPSPDRSSRTSSSSGALPDGRADRPGDSAVVRRAAHRPRQQAQTKADVTSRDLPRHREATGAKAGPALLIGLQHAAAREEVRARAAEEIAIEQRQRHRVDDSAEDYAAEELYY